MHLESQVIGEDVYTDYFEYSDLEYCITNLLDELTRSKANPQSIQSVLIYDGNELVTDCTRHIRDGVDYAQRLPMRWATVGLQWKDWGLAFGLYCLALLALVLTYVYAPLENYSIALLIFNSLGIEKSSDSGTTVVLIQLTYALTLCFFVRYLIRNIPDLAHREERDFRLSVAKLPLSTKIRKQIRFILGHILIYIFPEILFAIVAITIAFNLRFYQTLDSTGSLFSAVLASTRLHVAYNALITMTMGVVIITITTGLFI